ncbi:MAG: archaetidylserine decarboxylase [Gammaproteobacteria bacterium]|nr:archaetidylserine decarboxylase [Gammaproteobacteria bacterium]
MERFKAYLQYIYPKRFFSWFMLRWTRIRFRPVAQFQIHSFVRTFRVDVSEALEPNLSVYPDFNTFFTRPLAADARPIDNETDAIVSPADGVVAACGAITEGLALQAKGQPYSVAELLGNDPELAASVEGGTYVTVYLSPRDYHRIHACANAQLQKIAYVPGELFSVSPSTTHFIPRLFARNERAVLAFSHTRGPIAMVLVGAVCVGSVETIWTGAFPAHTPASQVHNAEVRKGQEIGRFNMGSTVIVLLPPGAELRVTDGSAIRMGEALASLPGVHA